jgi:hypothetical protein
MATTEQISVKAAGEVQVDELVLIANIVTNGKSAITEVELKYTFVELNLFEDMFANSLYGNVLISDSNALLDQVSIQGLEGLRINVRTPGLSDKQRIYKTFGIYSVTDVQVINNDRLQSYRLHFTSLELLADALNKPLNRAFPGTDAGDASSDSMIPFIYKTYFVGSGANKIARNLKLNDNGVIERITESSSLVMGAAPYDYTSINSSDGIVYNNSSGSGAKMKFIACNWTPLKTINWIANRAVPTNKARGGSSFFYESNKAYHFASVDDLIKSGKQDTGIKFVYKYSPANLVQDVNSPGYSLDVAAEYGRVLKMQINNNLNLLDNMNMGFFGQQVRAIDPVLKRYRELNYSFENQFQNFEHTTSKGTAIGMFPKAPDYLLGRKNTVIDPRRNIPIRFRTPYFLFDQDEQTPIVNEVNWLSQRAARIASISNYTIQILVPGRTDIKVGDVVNFNYPGLLSDPKVPQSPFYDGFFLITSIRHFISPIKHSMTMEIVKDAIESLADNPDPPTDPNLNYTSA